MTTVLPGVALLYLAYNMAKPWAIRLYCSFLSSSTDARRLQPRLSAAEEAAARAVVWAAARVSVEAGSWSLALLALAHRCGLVLDFVFLLEVFPVENKHPSNTI